MLARKASSECFDFKQTLPDGLGFPWISFPGYGTESEQLVPLIALGLEGQERQQQDMTWDMRNCTENTTTMVAGIPGLHIKSRYLVMFAFRCISWTCMRVPTVWWLYVMVIIIWIFNFLFWWTQIFLFFCLTNFIIYLTGIIFVCNLCGQWFFWLWVF